jgi:hypothetical protein
MEFFWVSLSAIEALQPAQRFNAMTTLYPVDVTSASKGVGFSRTLEETKIDLTSI